MAQAVLVCREIEAVACQQGAHVALTGGALYKSGDRKDVDVMLYRHKRAKPIDVEKILACAMLTVVKRFRWLTKCTAPNGIKVDVFHLEDQRNAASHEYPE
jgi:hypothetical protein